MTRHAMISLSLVVLLFSNAIRAAEDSTDQPAPTMYAEVQYMQVADGNDELYLKVEEAWLKVHAARKELGITTASAVHKVKRTTGPESDYNYVVVHIYDSWDKIETPYPWDVIESKLSLTPEDEEIFDKTSASRTMVRTELWKLEDVAMLERLGTGKFDKTIQLGFMKSKKSDHLSHEKQVWKKIWAKACEDGLRLNWNVWSRRFPGGSKHVFDLVAVHFFPNGDFNKPFPEGWWKNAGPKLFPDKTSQELDSLIEETAEIRDIPVTEEWTIVVAVGMDE